MGRILAIDYGRKRCGLAVTDPEQIIGNPLSTVSTHELIPFLEKYIVKEDVECIVIGEPRQMDNTASEAEQFIRPFVKQLRKLFPEMKIERVDERFTSLMASQSILESGAKKKDRQDKGLVDKVSAAIILQTYLDMR
jgi:putative Holliday junction resolvase